jgi:hypothetical protein
MSIFDILSRASMTFSEFPDFGSLIISNRFPTPETERRVSLMVAQT